MSADLTVAEFFRKHAGAPTDLQEWALKNCRTMHHAWYNSDLDGALWIATRPGVTSEKALRMLGIRFAMAIECLLPKRSLTALKLGAQYLDGKADDKQLSKAIKSAEATAAAQVRRNRTVTALAASCAFGAIGGLVLPGDYHHSLDWVICDVEAAVRLAAGSKWELAAKKIETKLKFLLLEQTVDFSGGDK